MSEMHMLEKKLIKGVPIMDPITKMAKTPLVSGDLKPYLSIMTPKLGSRQMELAIPITSLLNPKSKATGNAIRVPKSPKSCKIKAGPTLKIISMDCPLEIANLAIKTPINKTIAPSATFDCFLPINFIGFAKKRAKPMIRAYIKGNNKTLMVSVILISLTPMAIEMATRTKQTICRLYSFHGGRFLIALSVFPLNVSCGLLFDIRSPPEKKFGIVFLNFFSK